MYLTVSGFLHGPNIAAIPSLAAAMQASMLMCHDLQAWSLFVFNFPREIHISHAFCHLFLFRFVAIVVGLVSVVLPLSFL